MSRVMNIIESVILNQSKVSEAAERCWLHPEVRSPAAANRGMAHPASPFRHYFIILSRVFYHELIKLYILLPA